MTQEQVAAQKQFILEMANQLKKAGQLDSVPFGIKQQIIKLVVNRVIVDTREQSLRIEGAISETYALISVAGSTRIKTHQIEREEMTSETDPIVITSNRIPRPA